MPKLRSISLALIVGLSLAFAHGVRARPIVVVDKAASGTADLVGAPAPENGETDSIRREAGMATMVASILFTARRCCRVALSKPDTDKDPPKVKPRVAL